MGKGVRVRFEVAMALLWAALAAGSIVWGCVERGRLRPTDRALTKEVRRG